MKYLFTLFLFIILSSHMFAQEIKKNNILEDNHQTIVVDTLDFFTNFKKHYSDISFLSHSFDYERTNEINKLRRLSRDVKIMGYATMLGIFFLNGYLADKYDWSLWIDIPCAVAVTGVVCYAFNKWSDSLNKRAESIEEQITYFFQVGENMDIGLSKYTCRYDSSYNGIGLGFKVMF